MLERNLSDEELFLKAGALRSNKDDSNNLMTLALQTAGGQPIVELFVKYGYFISHELDGQDQVELAEQMFGTADNPVSALYSAAMILKRVG